MNNPSESVDSSMVRTRGQNVLKRPVEMYTRKMWCGLEACYNCNDQSYRAAFFGHLKLEVLNHERHRKPHVVIPDKRTFIEQIDVFESEHCFHNVILLFSTLMEIKKHSVTIYARLRDLFIDPERPFFVFDDIHQHDLPELSGIEKEDPFHCFVRFIIAVRWYQKHLPKLNVLVLTSDEYLQSRLNFWLIKHETIDSYIGGCLTTLRENLSPLVRLQFDEEENASFKACFKPYITNDEAMALIRSGTCEIYQGVFRVNGMNFLEGHVEVEGLKKPVLVQGHQQINRAIDGDLVVVKLYSKSEWTLPSESVIEDEPNVELNELLAAAEENFVQVGRNATEDQLMPTGEVVGIVRRNWKQLCGVFETSKFSKGRCLFVPAQRKYPRVRVNLRYDKYVGKKVVVVIDDWPQNSRYPTGHFIRMIGNIGDMNAENEVLLLEHDITHSKFSERVCKYLPALPWVITEEDVKARVDLRDVNICSVDPVGCTDIDDALHCVQLPNGNFEVGVHIADVSHFIRPGNALDIEASNRGTTVYLVGRRIDMVPELLSSNLCSLRENEPRFAFSCIWNLNPNAEIISTRFHKSIIRSRRAFTYEQAENAINNALLTDDLTVSLRHLRELSKILKSRRLEKGALVLSSPEVRFQVDDETHDPLAIKTKTLLSTMSMVEEFMLLANISVAERIYEEFKTVALLRRHPQPTEEMFSPLVKAVNNLGFTMDTSSGKAMAKSLDDVKSMNNKQLNTIVRILATRCMYQAQYFCSGEFQFDDYFHYGLGIPLYTHFTSPIRRYADVIVHRLLAAAIGVDKTYPLLLDLKYSTKLCENLNYRNRMAQRAARASIAINTHIYFRNRICEEEGYILSIRKNALQVLIPRYGLEGTIFLESRDADEAEYYPSYEYDQDRDVQVFGDVSLKTFDPVTVQLSVNSANIQHERIVMVMLKPIRIGKVAELRPTDEPVTTSQDSSHKNQKRKDTSLLPKEDLKRQKRKI